MEWHNLNKQKPTNNQEIICWNGITSVMGIYDEISNKIQVQRYATIGDRISVLYWDNVTHWMPKPLKPKEL